MGLSLEYEIGKTTLIREMLKVNLSGKGKWSIVICSLLLTFVSIPESRNSVSKSSSFVLGYDLVISRDSCCKSSQPTLLVKHKRDVLEIIR